MALTMDSLFKEAVEQSASDIHLLAGLRPHLRIDGELKPYDGKELSAKDIEILVKQIVNENDFKKFLIEKNLDFAHENSDGYRFRINIHFERGLIGLSARTIPSEIPSMEDIMMPEVVYNMCNQDRGLVLVTGPTGCGKSTTLAAMINYINETKNDNIITLEDPIEFIFEPKKSIIRQRQLGDDMISFQDGLIHVLRQDPNVVMVGEMRDLETIATTITLAETGHLVFATLHTYNASQTIDRIIDIFPPHQQNQVRMQLSLTLKGVITQRLLTAKEGGRVAAREVLINNPAVANLIRENKVAQIKNVIQTGAKEGMITMDNSLADLLKKGFIDKAAYDENMLMVNGF